MDLLVWGLLTVFKTHLLLHLQSTTLYFKCTLRNCLQNAVCWKVIYTPEILPCWQQELSLCVCTHACMCTRRCMCTNTPAFTSMLQLFWKITVPLSVPKRRAETECAALSHSHAMLFRYNLRNNQQQHKSLAGPIQPLSLSVGTSYPRHIQLHHLLGWSHHWDTRLDHSYPCTGWMTVPLLRRRTVSSEPVMQWGDFKSVLKTASGLIKIVLLSYYSHNPAPDLRCFITSSSHSKWIFWVILRNRKRLWPIFRPSALAIKTRPKKKKKKLQHYRLVFLNKNNV